MNFRKTVYKQVDYLLFYWIFAQKNINCQFSLLWYWKCVCVYIYIMAVNAWCCGLLECANYGPAPQTSALRVSVRVISPLASGIRFSWKHSRREFTGPKLDLSPEFSPEAFPINGYAARQRRFPSPSTKQWNYLTHSWELGLQTLGHVTTGWAVHLGA